MLILRGQRRPPTPLTAVQTAARRRLGGCHPEIMKRARTNRTCRMEKHVPKATHLSVSTYSNYTCCPNVCFHWPCCTCATLLGPNTHTQTHPFGRNALKSVSAAILRRILKLNISISLNKFRATFWMPRICPKRSALRSSKRPGKLRSYWKAVEGDDLGDLDEGNTSWA